MRSSLRRLIPVIIVDVMLCVYGVLAYVFFWRNHPRVIEQNAESQTLVILGNGPSLSDDISGILRRRAEIRVAVVNYFANSELFSQLRPDFYVMADPIFWRQDIGTQHKESNEKLVANLLKVSWCMTVICREQGCEFFSNALAGNGNIRVEKIKDNSMDFRTDFFSVLSLRSPFFTPNFVNVLILALWSGITRGFRGIEIYGADFSSFKSLNVDQHSNYSTNETRHFYNKDSAKVEAQEKYPARKRKLIHTRMYQVALAFRQMYLLSRVARKRGISVVNGSSFSYLDCFDRIQPSLASDYDSDKQSKGD